MKSRNLLEINSKFDEGRFNEAVDEEGKVPVGAYEEEREKTESRLRKQPKSKLDHRRPCFVLPKGRPRY